MKIIFAILSIMVMLSCSNRREYINPYYITEKNMPALKQLELKKLIVPENCVYACSYVCHDSLFIAINPMFPDPYFITIYNTNNWKIVGEYFKKGNGPDELLFIYWYYANNRLIVKDPYKNYLTIINIDSLNKRSESPSFIGFNTEFGTTALLSDTVAIIQNKCYFNGINGFYVPNSVKEFYKMNLNAPGNTVLGEQNDFYPSNVNKCHITVNQKRKLIFCAYESSPKCTIMDYNFNVLKTIVGPDKDDAKYVLSQKMLSTINTYSFYTSISCSNDDFVFVLNYREHNINGNEHYEYIKNNHGEIFKFDWDGNLVERYALNQEILSLSLSDTSNNTIYLQGVDDNGEPVLFKTEI